jgi:hypothetical protein
MKIRPLIYLQLPVSTSARTSRPPVSCKRPYLVLGCHFGDPHVDERTKEMVGQDNVGVYDTALVSVGNTREMQSRP